MLETPQKFKIDFSTAWDVIITDSGNVMVSYFVGTHKIYAHIFPTSDEQMNTDFANSILRRVINHFNKEKSILYFEAILCVSTIHSTSFNFPSHTVELTFEDFRFVDTVTQRHVQI